MPRAATTWKHPELPLVLFQPESVKGSAKFYYRITLPGHPRQEGLLAKEFAYSDKHHGYLTNEWPFRDIQETLDAGGRPPDPVVLFAERLVYRLRERVGKGATLTTTRIPTMLKAGERFVDYLDDEFENGRIGKEHHKHYAGFVRRYVVGYPEFARLAVNEVTEEHLAQWQRWRDLYWIEGPGREIDKIPYERGGKKMFRTVTDEDRTAPTASTKSKERVYLTAVFHFAVDNKWMERRAIPRHDFSRSTITPATKRPAFSRPQWNRLRAFAESTWLNPAKLMGDSRRTRQLCWWYAVTLRAFGLRAAEGYALKFQNVLEDVDPQGTPLVLIHVPWIKTEAHERQVEPIFRFAEEMREVLLVKLPAFYDREYGFKPLPEDPLWMHPNRTPILSFYRGFESLLEDAGMTTDAEGNAFSLTSLRHSAITEEIETTELNVGIIADWAGTSIQMIQKHYSQPLTVRARRAEMERQRRMRGLT